MNFRGTYIYIRRSNGDPPPGRAYNGTARKARRAPLQRHRTEAFAGGSIYMPKPQLAHALAVMSMPCQPECNHAVFL